MSDELVFGSDVPAEAIRPPSPFLTPAVGAITGFTVAVLGLLGQNAVLIAFSLVFGPQFGRDDMSGYYVGVGVAVVAQALLAALLARRGLTAEGRWENHLGRAALLLAGLGVVAGAGTVIAALVRGPGGF